MLSPRYEFVVWSRNPDLRYKKKASKAGLNRSFDWIDIRPQLVARYLRTGCALNVQNPLSWHPAPPLGNGLGCNVKSLGQLLLRTEYPDGFIDWVCVFHERKLTHGLLHVNQRFLAALNQAEIINLWLTQQKSRRLRGIWHLE